MTVNRRQFIKNCFKIGGYAALLNAGISVNEAKSAGVLFMAGGVDSGTGCTGTYGRDTASSSNASQQSQIILTKITIDCSGTVDYVEQYLTNADDATREIKLLIYDDDGTAGEPSTRLYESAAVFGSSPAWISSGTGVGLGVSAGDYWVGCIFEAGSVTVHFEGSSGDARTYVNADFNPPATWPTSGVTTSTAERQVRMGF